MGKLRNCLLKTMHDPNSVMYSDNKVVIIKDKYPKSEYHYLVLPYEDIPNLNSCRYQHKTTLEYMEIKACEFAGIHRTRNEFWMGFHAQPSLNRLHLHLISNDFRGPGLMTAKQYNSFVTDFFLPSSDTISCIARSGYAWTPSEERCQQLLKTPLKCHICGLIPKNMPTLKAHLYSHIAEV